LNAKGISSSTLHRFGFIVFVISLLYLGRLGLLLY
jgi:hypothetical protein